MTRVSIAVLATLSVIGGCEGSHICLAIINPAIRLTVRDARTGALIATRTTVIANLRGVRPDTIVSPTGNTDSEPIVIGSSSGTYDLVVRTAGYADWVSNGIIVDRSDGACPNTVTRSIQATLQPTP